MRKGSCHCGSVQFTAEFVGEALVGSRCNCTICAMKGAVMVYLPMEAVAVTAGEADALACYRFNTMAAKHYFCARCGIHCFHQTRSDPDKYAVNAATLEGVRPYEDFPEVAVFDGQHHASDNGGVRRQAGWLRFEPTPGEPWPEGVI
ncbi:GFA family protein [Altererythrobacter buctensis]|uniref:GFA family protein n=1 Tax=Alteraurantiacibacter buctensis TaxID=1503981 RepID=A0A844YZY5_9SPHN|nr:GFA family protein [Alteraurantiacibacter buctensis]